MEERKLSIGSAGNTIRPTLLAIQKKGYIIHLSYSARYLAIDHNYENTKLEDITSNYSAEKDGYWFHGDSPEELLGLIAMWEVRGDDWKYDAEIEHDIHQELMQNATLYDCEGNVIDDENF